MNSYSVNSASDKPHRRVTWALPIFSSVTSIVMSILYIYDYPVELASIYTVILSTLFFLIYCYLVLYHFRYKVYKGNIEIYIGPILRKSIEIKKINEIRLKRRTLGIYGNSYETITLILITKKEINISPEDRSDFIEVILNCNSKIKYDAV